MLRSPIYPHLDDKLRTTYLILRYSPLYHSFQATRKAIAIKHPLLPYINVRCKGYILSPSECARQEEVQYHKKSPPPFTPEDLEVTLAVPIASDRLWRQRKKKTNRDTTNDPSPPYEELTIPAAILLDDPSTKMTFQRSRVTLAQVLAAPVKPHQTPPPTSTVSTPPSASPIIVVTNAPTRETRAGRKQPRGLNSEQPLAIPDSKSSPLDLGDTHVNVMGAPAYIKAFMVDGEALPTMEGWPFRKGC